MELMKAEAWFVDNYDEIMDVREQNEKLGTSDTEPEPNWILNDFLFKIEDVAQAWRFKKGEELSINILFNGSPEAQSFKYTKQLWDKLEDHLTT